MEGLGHAAPEEVGTSQALVEELRFEVDNSAARIEIDLIEELSFPS